MRLQVAILRHDLPTVRLLYNAASKHGPGTTGIVTVADLLSGLNALVPLESADGEWGLEDYVVEVAATSDQLQPYECFHFQEIKDVLREDDEVVIRGLTNEELRDRRQGGRLQISRNGKHLIDGLSWGKRWRAGVDADRPGITIPPRKRRRIMQEPESNEDSRLELEYPPSRELVPFRNVVGENEDGDEDDDEEDEDYETGEEQGSDEDEEGTEQDHLSEDEDITSSPARQVVKKVMFEDADPDDEDEIDPSEVDEDDEEDLSEGAEDFAAELKALTADAGTAQVDPGQPRLRRGNPIALEDVDSSQVGASPERFSLPSLGPQDTHLPTASSETTDSEPAEDAVGNVQDLTALPEECSSGALVTTEDLTEKPDQVSADVDGSQGKSMPAKDSRTQTPAALSSIDESEDEDSDATSSSEGSETTTSSEKADTKPDEETDTSPDESSDSGESTSNSNSSSGSVQSTAQSASSANLEENSAVLSTKDSPDTSKSLPHKNNPPGSGRNRTRRHNERKKMSKLLSKLKEEGRIDKDADFKALREYLTRSDTQKGQQDEVDENNAQEIIIQEKVSARAQEILARLNQPGEPILETNQSKEATASSNHNDHVASNSLPLNPPTEQVVVEVNTVTYSEPTPNSATETTLTSGQKQNTAEMDSEETSPKRARLDVAASRRMLFNSLGVRNPKDAQAEKALREKLAEPTRQVIAREPGPREATKPQASLAPDRWKKKFTVLAVECIQDWRKIDPPPFPFKQPWQVRQERDEMAKSARQQEIYENALNYDEVEETADDQEVNHTQPMDIDHEPVEDHPSQSLTTSRTLTAGTTGEEDDIPEPSDFTILPTLTKWNLSQAAVVAYKEWQLNARSEPEHSPYRIARVISYADGTLQVRLAPRYRSSANTNRGEETWPRRYSLFGAPDDEREESSPDDGIREIGLSLMIDPKIVAMPVSDRGSAAQNATNERVELVVVNGEAVLRGGHLGNAVKHSFKAIGSEVDVSTPRRAEINDMIKEAGFESAVGAQLFQGLMEPEAPNETSIMVRDGPAAINGVSQTHAPPQEKPIHPGSPVHGSADVSAFRESSAPSESMVESVNYPHLSEIEPDTPMPAQSSSHQDAQKTASTPVLPPEDSTNLDTTLPEPADHLDTQPDSLPSEVPQTQSQDFIPDSLHGNQDDVCRPPISPPSDIGPGLDGTTSPRQQKHAIQDLDATEHDNNNYDDSGSIGSSLPSARDLVSSQIPKHSNPSLSKSSVSKIQNISPEPRRRSPPTGKSIVRSSDWSDSETTSQDQSRSQSQAQPQPTFQTTFKQSQSQPTYLSQIPDDTIVVDLTHSSDVGSPQKSNNKGKGKEREKENGTSRAATKGAAGRGPPLGTFRKSFEGLGEKSLLKRKKKGI